MSRKRTDTQALPWGQPATKKVRTLQHPQQARLSSWEAWGWQQKNSNGWCSNDTCWNKRSAPQGKSKGSLSKRWRAVVHKKTWGTRKHDRQPKSAAKNWSQKEKQWGSFWDMQLHTKLTTTSTARLRIKLPGDELAHIATLGNHGRHQLDLGPMRVRVLGSVESLGGAGGSNTWEVSEGKDLIWDTNQWTSSLLPVPPNTKLEFRLGNLWHHNKAYNAPGLQSGWERETNHEYRQFTWSGLCCFESPGPGEVLEVTLPPHVAKELYDRSWEPYCTEVYTKNFEGVKTLISPLQEFVISSQNTNQSWQKQQLPLPEAGKQRTFAFRGGLPGDEIVMNTNIYLPPGFYDRRNEGKRWPLIVFLHSQYSRLDGDMNLFYESSSPTRLVLGDEKCPDTLWKEFVVLTPQNLSSRERGDWNGDGMWLRRGVLEEGTTFDTGCEALLRDLIDTVVHNMPVDGRRISLVGTSMGGQGVLQLASRWPGYFAACVPVAAHFEFEPLENVAKRLAIKALPMWFFHAENDHICSIKPMKELARHVRNHSKAKVRFTSFQDNWSSGHCADRVPFWKNAMSKKGSGGWECYGDDLFAWLLKQRGPGSTPKSLTRWIVEKKVHFRH